MFPAFSNLNRLTCMPYVVSNSVSILSISWISSVFFLSNLTYCKALALSCTLAKGFEARNVSKVIALTTSEWMKSSDLVELSDSGEAPCRGFLVECPLSQDLHCTKAASCRSIPLTVFRLFFIVDCPTCPNRSCYIYYLFCWCRQPNVGPPKRLDWWHD